MSSDRIRRIAAIGALVTLGSLVWLAAGPPGARAAAPLLKRFAGMTPDARAQAFQAYKVAFDKLRANGVDRIYPQFALDMAKYPRQGVAHRNVLVVLCKFPSEGSAPAQGPSGASTPFYVYKHFFSEDPNDGLISLREYYQTNSRGRLVISGQVTSDWLNMPHSYDYYANSQAGLDFGGYPRSSQKLAEDAMAAAAQDFGGDLSYFDNDGPDGIPSSGDDDGYIDAVSVIVTGQGGEVSCADPNNCNRLWSHESGIALYSNCPSGTNAGPGCLPGAPFGSVRGFLYSLASEYNDFPGDNATGTWFHEFSHTLGLPDLYDFTGYGLGYYSLMAFGNYLPNSVDANVSGGPTGSNPGNLDAWCRQFLGFDDPVPISTEGHYTLPPVSRGGGSRRVWSNGESGTEYYIVENRLKEGSDRFLPGEGMLVYHVDDTKIDNLGGYPTYRASIVQADSVNPLQLEFGANPGDSRDFFPGPLLKRSLTDATQPDSRSWAGLDTGIRIWNIAGKADGADTASFDLRVSVQPELRLTGYTIDDGGGDGYADPNETDQLTMSVRNIGLQSGPVHLTLSTSDAAVTVTQALVNGGAVAPGEAR